MTQLIGIKVALGGAERYTKKNKEKWRKESRNESRRSLNVTNLFSEKALTEKRRAKELMDSEKAQLEHLLKEYPNQVDANQMQGFVNIIRWCEDRLELLAELETKQ